MSIAGGLRCAPDDPVGLKREIERRNRIIEVLLQQAERGVDPAGCPTLLQTNAALENLVRKRTGDLVRSVEELEMFIRNAPAGIVFTRNHVILRYNHQFGRIFGLDADEGIGQSTRILFRSDQEFEDAKIIVDPILSAAKTHCIDAFMRHRNGSDIWVHSVGYAIANEAPGISAVWMLEDHTAIKVAEEALNHSNAELRVRSRNLERRELELRTILDSASDVYISFDTHGIISSWNRQAEILFGWSAAEVIGKQLTDICIVPEIREGFFENLHSGAWLNQRLEHPSCRRDGSRITVEVRVNMIEFEGEQTYYVFLHDITERKANEAKREFEARHDVLTGLLNRRGLMEELPLAVARAERSEQTLALLFLDLDGFKTINDTYGHEIGDCVLREVAHRARLAIRQTDLAARLAGDEFIIVLENLESLSADAPHYAQRLIDALSLPISMGGHTFPLGVSIGILGYTHGSRLSMEDLIQQADQAMYHAKKAGKGCYFLQKA